MAVQLELFRRMLLTILALTRVIQFCIAHFRQRMVLGHFHAIVRRRTCLTEPILALVTVAICLTIIVTRLTNFVQTGRFTLLFLDQFSKWILANQAHRRQALAHVAQQFSILLLRFQHVNARVAEYMQTAEYFSRARSETLATLVEYTPWEELNSRWVVIDFNDLI